MGIFWVGTSPLATALLASQQWHPALEEDFVVCNLTIDGMHNYAVGHCGVLVHNAASCTPGENYFALFGRLKHQSYMDDIANGVDTIKEFVFPSGRQIDFIDIENGIVFELQPNNNRKIREGIRQIRNYIAELQTMPQFSGINWKGIVDVYY